jgi:6,7-dimethyl-8-ribityllumazine synthase
MLKKVTPKMVRRTGGRFAIVASRYNSQYVNAMVRAAERTLKGAGGRVEVVRVPGAFEIPAVTARLATGGFDALICLGVILRGATTHAQHIGEAVTNALVLLQVKHQLPVIHEVLLLENEEQARDRCLSPKHNRGVEAAQTALEMAALMRRLGAAAK